MGVVDSFAFLFKHTKHTGKSLPAGKKGSHIFLFPLVFSYNIPNWKPQINSLLFLGD
jgi:hypothetical protein